MFGKATCQQGQHSHVHVLHNDITTYVASAHYEGATLYSFSVLAQLDDTLYEHRRATAEQAVAHLMQIEHKATPF